MSLHFNLITAHPAYLCKEATNTNISETGSIKQTLEESTQNNASDLLTKWKLPQNPCRNGFTYCHVIIYYPVRKKKGSLSFDYYSSQKFTSQSVHEDDVYIKLSNQDFMGTLHLFIYIPQIFECPLVEIKVVFDHITFTGIWFFIHFNLFRNRFHFPWHTTQDSLMLKSFHNSFVSYFSCLLHSKKHSRN